MANFKFSLCSICGILLLASFSMIILCSSAQESLSVPSTRCLSICRRDEESLCKRCLFREPMRFGKRTSTNFREPMRFGKKSKEFREVMRFGKRREFREAMRFGKRQESGENIGPIIEDYVLPPDTPVAQWNGAVQSEPVLNSVVTSSEEMRPNSVD